MNEPWHTQSELQPLILRTSMMFQERITVMRPQLMRINADIIYFQEVNGAGNTWSTPPIACFEGTN